MKCTSTSYDWQVYHRGMDGSAPEDYRLNLNNTTARADNASIWNDTAPTSTEFTVGTNANVNQSGQTYIAYLFAHDTASDSNIKCGSYTGDGSTTNREINTGFKPAWIMIKNTSSTYNWNIIDSVSCLLYTSPSPRDGLLSRMPSSA